MRILGAISLLWLSLSCGSAQVYTTQSTDDAVSGVGADVVWHYTVVMNRLLMRDFAAETLNDPKFVNAFTQKTMTVVSDRLMKDLGTAVKIGAIVTSPAEQVSS